jgi:hypothetical protein
MARGAGDVIAVGHAGVEEQTFAQGNALRRGLIISRIDLLGKSRRYVDKGLGVINRLRIDGAGPEQRGHNGGREPPKELNGR